jgi:DNA polymerase elongation subunit (family B)
MPAQVQLAERMKRRGVPVDIGSRIEYVVTRKIGASTLGQKIEDYDYFMKHSDVLDLDPNYYVEAMINPLDQIFKTMGYGNMMKQISLKWAEIAKEREDMNHSISFISSFHFLLSLSSITLRGDRTRIGMMTP